MKPNNEILYVNIGSNHPPNILENIPASVNKRLSMLSKTEEIFNNSAVPYQEALKKSGYSYKLKFNPIEVERNRRKRSRKIIWYNPPFSQNVKTNIGKEFFRILEECFPPENSLHKIFNKNSVKISYSCMPNFGTIISGQNKKILGGTSDPPPCKCRDFDCPVEGKCETTGVIYQCEVKRSSDGHTESYVGLTENSFKIRYYKHRKSFNTENYQKTSLSNYIWKLKKRRENFEISWKILSKARPYSPSKKICELCNRERYYIMYYSNSKATLNKRTEFFSHCLHKDKFLLKNQ